MHGEDNPWRRTIEGSGRLPLDRRVAPPGLLATRKADGVATAASRCLVTACLMPTSSALSTLVSNTETGQEGLIMKSISAGASGPVANMRLLTSRSEVVARCRTKSLGLSRNPPKMPCKISIASSPPVQTSDLSFQTQAPCGRSRPVRGRPLSTCAKSRLPAAV